MTELKALLWIVLAVGIATLAIYAVYYGMFLSEGAAKARTDALRQIARSRSLHYNKLSDYKHTSTYRAFKYFNKGSDPVCNNTIEGVCKIRGRPHKIKMGDFRYTIVTDDGPETYEFSYLCVHLPYMGVPDLVIRRENLLDKIKSSVGVVDINFESAHFSKKYYVKSSNKKFAYSVISPLMIEDSMTFPLPNIELLNGIICCTDGKTKWKPEEFIKRLDPVADFIKLWPEHVIADLEHKII